MADAAGVRRALAGFALALLAPLLAVAAPKVSFTASRMQGCVAPCAVFFDATATNDASTDAPFHDLDYRWNFGDEHGETWSLSGLPKNVAVGGIAGHLFTRPGTWTVTLAVTNRAGALTTATQTLRIADPEVAFAGDKTRCVSVAGNFEGCPAGAAKVRSADFDASVANAPGRRTLLRRGETFEWDQPLRLVDATAAGSSIGAYGGGTARATLRVKGASRVVLDPGNDWRVAHLAIVAAGAKESAIDEKGGVARFTAFDLEVRGFDGCATFWSPPKPDAEVAFVDVRCADFPDPGTGTKFYEDTERSMFLGLEIDKGDMRDPRDQTEFAYRTVYSQKKLIQHGRFQGRAPNHSKGLLQLRHCSAIGPWAKRCPDGKTPSRYVIVSDNHFIDGGGPRAMTVIRICDHGTCGGRPGESQPVEDYIFERNLFQVHVRDVATEKLASVFDIQAARTTLRNNVADLQGWPQGRPGRAIFAFAEPPSNPARERGGRIWVLNNTIYLGRDFPGSVALCAARGAIDAGVCANNLVYAPGLGGQATPQLGQAWTALGNVLGGGASPFLGPLPAALRVTRRDLAAFALAPGAAIGSAVAPGAGVPSVQDDVFGRCRGAGRPTDVGAAARSARSCAPKQGG